MATIAVPDLTPEPSEQSVTMPLPKSTPAHSFHGWHHLSNWRHLSMPFTSKPIWDSKLLLTLESSHSSSDSEYSDLSSNDETPDEESFTTDLDCESLVDELVGNLDNADHGHSSHPLPAGVSASQQAIGHEVSPLASLQSISAEWACPTPPEHVELSASGIPEKYLFFFQEPALQPAGTIYPSGPTSIENLSPRTIYINGVPYGCDATFPDYVWNHYGAIYKTFIAIQSSSGPVHSVSNMLPHVAYPHSSTNSRQSLASRPALLFSRFLRSRLLSSGHRVPAAIYAADYRDMTHVELSDHVYKMGDCVAASPGKDKNRTSTFILSCFNVNAALALCSVIHKTFNEFCVNYWIDIDINNMGDVRIIVNACPAR